MTEDTGGVIVPKKRIAAIDQLRGFAIFGMILVDYWGMFDVFGPLEWLWNQLHHHRTGVTFADTVAPLFMFVVGMGLRLSMKRRIEEDGLHAARIALTKRYAILVTIAFTQYTGYLWDALMNIGLAGLIAIWVVDKRPAARFLVGLALLAAFQAIFSFTSYGEWLLRDLKYDGDNMPLIFKLIPIGPELVEVAINGGPIGHWSWFLMLICGTIAYDIMATKDTRKIITGTLVWGVALLAVGALVKMQWGDFKAEWPYSKYYMTAPFAFWGAGMCFLQLLAFYVICDVLKWRIPHLTTFGMNPLFIYIFHWCILASAGRFINDETQNVAGIVIGWFVFYGVCYGAAYYLYRKKIFIKL